MFKAPDITGPRLRKDWKGVLNLKLFQKFKDRYPKHNITFEQFSDVIVNHSGKMWKEVIDSRDGIALPESIGTVFLASTKITKKKNVNIQASIAANTEIMHRNWDTDGHVAKIFFTDNLVRGNSTTGKGLWAFTGQRTFKRTISKEYAKDWKKYVVIIGRKKASQIYKKHMMRDFAKKKAEEGLITYNEFN